MTKVAITEQYLTDIADAIRAKTGMSTATYYPSQMATAISTISGSGGITPTGTISITENGTYNVTSYASASVSVPTGSTINNQNKTVNPSTSQQSITADSGYTGLGTVTINAIPAGTAGTPTASKGTVSNNSISVTPSVTNTTGYITGSTKTGTAVTVSASELVSGNKSITANGSNIDVTNYATVSVSVSDGGGGGSDVAEAQVDTDLESNSYTLTFTGLQGEPTSFVVMYDDGMSVPSGTPYRVLSVVYDGTDVHAQTLTNTNNAQVSYDGSNFSQSYSNGTLMITSTGAQFISGWWVMSYTYGGTAGNIKTEDVQVGSGATSITFTGLEDEPICWYLIFKSNFGTSSGYQRVIAVRKREQDGAPVNVYGFAMDSSAHGNSTSWSESYNDGSLTITSQGTNNGGYFHQPGYYQLTYAVSGGGGGGSPTLETVTKSYTPTESVQTETITASSGYDAIGEVDVTVGAISSTYVGSGITSRNSSDLTASGATVTVPAGYYSSQATKSVNTMTLPTGVDGSATSGYTQKASIVRSNYDQYLNIPPGYNSSGAYYVISAVANGSATGPSSLSGSSATISTGTNTITLTKTDVTTTPTVSAGYVSSATASTATVSLTASINTRSSSDLTASNLTVTAPSGYYANAATKTLSDANLVADNIKKNVTIFGTTGTYEGSGGGSGSSMVVATATKTLTSAASSISFTGLSGEPTSFAVTSSTDQTTGGTKVVAVTYDGTNLYGIDLTTQAANDTGFTQSYSNGTLTITATTASFQANEYKLVYSYGGTAANIGGGEVQVGSGATSITFTGLEDEPEYFSCIFKSTFSTSSGYQRVMDVVYDGTSTYGHALDSSAHALTSWSYTYNSGSLTISSTGTNNGGYFHQPGYYQLIYAIGDDSSLQKKTVTPTSSDQTITADTAQGYTALSQVKVEGVTCSNLTAANIKSGVTVKIGTDTDDDSVTSVTGTYSAGGGSSSIDTKTTTSSNRPTSLSFSSMKGEPQTFVLRCTSSMSRSSNSTYYYVATMRYNGTNTNGNCWRMSNGNWTNITSGYSWSYSGTTLTLTSSGSTTTSPGCFYPGNYELVYTY